MSEADFYKLFWNNFLQLEDEFKSTFGYVECSSDNYDTYSLKYLKLYLQIGSEIDVCFKEYLKLINPNFNGINISQYRDELLTNDLDFFNEKVEVVRLNLDIQPWLELQNNNTTDCWTSYNKVKHNRYDIVTISNVSQEAYKFANLKNILTAFCGLYVLQMNIYAKVKNGYNESPIPNSSLFKMSSQRWSNCKFFKKLYSALGMDGDIYLINEE